MKGTLYIDGKTLVNDESIAISKSTTSDISPMDFIKDREINVTIQLNERFNKLALLPNGYKIKKLLDIAERTSKTRTIKKLYRRAYKLSSGLPLKAYK